MACEIMTVLMKAPRCITLSASLLYYKEWGSPPLRFYVQEGHPDQATLPASNVTGRPS